MKEITVHTLVKNEARFVWFAVMSVVDMVDKVLLWDTGSTDGTIEIVKEIKRRFPGKVDLQLLGEVDINQFALVRQEMLEATKTDWLIVVDGDEIWWDESIKKVVAAINSTPDIESIVVPTINLVGDIYHFQEEAAGLYRLAGKRGHYSLRAVNRAIPGLASSRPHGTWGWIDIEGKMIQDRDSKKIKFVAAPYLHASFLARADSPGGDSRVPKRLQKRKHEIGIEFPKDFYYPEAFFRFRPEFVASPWEKMDLPFYLKSMVETPLRKLKRSLLPARVGY